MSRYIVLVVACVGLLLFALTSFVNIARIPEQKTGVFFQAFREQQEVLIRQNEAAKQTCRKIDKLHGFSRKAAVPLRYGWLFVAASFVLLVVVCLVRKHGSFASCCCSRL